MFSSEREMQDLFVILLKKKKTCGLIFEDVPVNMKCKKMIKENVNF